ncbi:MAG TPA: hypothetical protein VGJ30_08520, partial [Candidatus Angelobacter sp.]
MIQLCDRVLVRAIFALLVFGCLAAAFASSAQYGKKPGAAEPSPSRSVPATEQSELVAPSVSRP